MQNIELKIDISSAISPCYKPCCICTYLRCHGAVIKTWADAYNYSFSDSKYNTGGSDVSDRISDKIARCVILSRRRQNAESEPADKDFQFFGNGVDRELRSIQFALGPIYPPWQYGVRPPLSLSWQKSCKKKFSKFNKNINN